MASPVEDRPASVVVSSDDVPLRARADYWQHVAGDTVAPMEMRYDDPAGFRSSMRVHALGELTLIEVDESAGRAWRTHRHIRRSTPDVYQLMVQERGTAVADADGRQVAVAANDIRLADPSRPFRIAHSDQREVILTFPRALLPIRARDAAPLVGRPIDGDRGMPALLSEFVRRLPGSVGDANAVQRGRLGAVALDLLTVALSGPADAGPAATAGASERTLLDRIDMFIDSRLHERELTPSMIAAAHFISPRYLHKLFESRDESVGQWIRRRRLERCRRDLADPGLAGRPAYAIGMRWGFAEAAHFSRSFRDEYGLTPGEFRRAAGVGRER